MSISSQFARTKIVATVGPACDSIAKLEGLMRAGADVFRINGAHIETEEIEGWVKLIRTASKRCKTHAAVMMDLPGTKTRVGELLPDGVRDLRNGETVRLVDRDASSEQSEIPVEPGAFLETVKRGHKLLLADGRIELKATHRRGRVVTAVVTHGEVLMSRKGVHAPDSQAGPSVPTARDRALAAAALAADVDMLALSFVSGSEDVVRLRRLMKREGRPLVPVVVKIERRSALEVIDEIMVVASCVMVARGDLGVEIGPEAVPTAQRTILASARRAGRPAVVATEMLDSMISRPRPTRAEAQDVATAVAQHADAVMLSAETAVGENPKRAVATMNHILLAAEREADEPTAHRRLRSDDSGPVIVPTRPDQHVVRAAVDLATYTGASAMLVLTRAGASAFRLSKERPRAPIFALTYDDEVCRRVSLCWGVRAQTISHKKDTKAAVEGVLESFRRARILKKGDRIVLVKGGESDPAGTTTMIRFVTV